MLAGYRSGTHQVRMEFAYDGGGLGKGYRQVVLPERTPIGDLWLSVAHKFGDKMTEFGDGNKPISRNRSAQRLVRYCRPSGRHRSGGCRTAQRCR